MDEEERGGEMNDKEGKRSSKKIEMKPMKEKNFLDYDHQGFACLR